MEAQTIREALDATNGTVSSTWEVQDSLIVVRDAASEYAALLEAPSRVWWCVNNRPAEIDPAEVEGSKCPVCWNDDGACRWRLLTREAK